jgi:hypothetical protein
MQLRDLNRSGWIDFFWNDDFLGQPRLSVHALYREFAEWYVTEHEAKGLKNAWGVFQTSSTSLGCNPATSKCWSDLVRLRLFDLTRADARFVAGKMMQELHNLEVLQLHSCTNLTALNLEGLESLRHLELVKLTRLVTVTLSGSSSADEKGGIHESLRIVVLEDLESLTHVPDFRSCICLVNFLINRCKRVTNFEGIECPHLNELELRGLVPHQWTRLPNVKSLHSLTLFSLRADFHVYWSDLCRWFAKLESREPKGPVFKILNKVLRDHPHWVEDAPPSDREVYAGDEVYSDQDVYSDEECYPDEEGYPDEADSTFVEWVINLSDGCEELIWNPSRQGTRGIKMRGKPSSRTRPLVANYFTVRNDTDVAPWEVGSCRKPRHEIRGIPSILYQG